MKAQEKKGLVSWLWSMILLPLIEKHGVEFIDWLIEMLKNKKEDEGGVTTQGENGGTYPNCNPGYYADTTTRKCMPITR